jgi:Xaa-Pro aminopeptidase
MGATAPGTSEQELAALVEYEFARRGGVPFYETILTARGEILHNHAHGGTLRQGDLLLLDAGAEMDSGWGCDMTRTWPASGRFTPEQRDVYDIVHAAFREAVGRIRPGESWREIHLAAARVIAAGLVDLGVLRGDPADLVERGAHAPFFPHGLGHHLGLETHDIEHFGDRFLYAPDRPRASQFGLAYLRTDLDLEPGMVLTVEPGLYFSPDILAAYRDSFADVFVPSRIDHYLSANDGRGFGGIRLEDDFVVTAEGAEDLTPGVPMEPGDVEAAVGTGGAAPVARTG